MRRGFVGGFAGHRKDKLLSCIYVRMCTRAAYCILPVTRLLTYRSPCLLLVASDRPKISDASWGHPYANMCV